MNRIYFVVFVYLLAGCSGLERKPGFDFIDDREQFHLRFINNESKEEDSLWLNQFNCSDPEGARLLMARSIKKADHRMILSQYVERAWAGLRYQLKFLGITIDFSEPETKRYYYTQHNNKGVKDLKICMIPKKIRFNGKVIVGGYNR